MKKYVKSKLNSTEKMEESNKGNRKGNSLSRMSSNRQRIWSKDGIFMQRSIRKSMENLKKGKLYSSCLRNSKNISTNLNYADEIHKTKVTAAGFKRSGQGLSLGESIKISNTENNLRKIVTNFLLAESLSNRKDLLVKGNKDDTLATQIVRFVIIDALARIMGKDLDREFGHVADTFANRFVIDVLNDKVRFKGNNKEKAINIAAITIENVINTYSIYSELYQQAVNNYPDFDLRSTAYEIMHCIIDFETPDYSYYDSNNQNKPTNKPSTTYDICTINNELTNMNININENDNFNSYNKKDNEFESIKKSLFNTNSDSILSQLKEYQLYEQTNDSFSSICRNFNKNCNEMDKSTRQSANVNNSKVKIKKQSASGESIKVKTTDSTVNAEANQSTLEKQSKDEIIKRKKDKEELKIVNETEENQVEIQTIEFNEEENERDHCIPCRIKGKIREVNSSDHLLDDDCDDIFDYILCNKSSTDNKE
ncbi:DgyrCDS8700 [Dimorphilus gyrociliatus]|uniref:DgyrCDS8700 n=1 Tax=Dimorphilus gyrociliatus TaxID=2664684 RepID=A0A7I8VV01_9ANNE|nr:DgyrCDS8700 [Dimorphilus gyrociliatus]